MKPVVFALFAGMVGFALVQPVPAAEAAKFSEKILYSFGGSPDGAKPYDSVIDFNGTLCGTTVEGGGYCPSQPEGCGTVFSLDRNTGAEKVRYSFCSRANCADGAFPDASLINVKGTLYGTTYYGGHNQGTVFAFDLNTNTEKTVYSFCSRPNCADGRASLAGLIKVNGALYGTTMEGGRTGCNNLGCGTVFSINRNTGAEQVIYSFCSQPNCADGATPHASVIDANGMLYGTTLNGGRGNGTVFSIDPSTGAEKVLYSFCSQPNCADGAGPLADLIDVNGTLYGTTGSGGVTGCRGSGCGTVFSIDLNTDAEKVLYSFCSQPNCTDGAKPEAGLTNVTGNLYGTAATGGAYGYGTVFVLKKKR